MDFNLLQSEAYEYLEKTKALFGNPFERLTHLNKPAVDLFIKHGVDLNTEPLEIAICVQHNNGGLDVDLWWQTELKGFFAIGETAATHGVYRPGGSALNAGQVGAQRAALFIAMKRKEEKDEIPDAVLETFISPSLKLASVCLGGESNVNQYYENAQKKMSNIAGMIRKKEEIEQYLKELRNIRKEFASIIKINNDKEIHKIFLLWDMLLSQEVYLIAMLDYLEHGGKSRGSALYSLKQNKKQSSVFDTFSYEKDNSEMAEMVQLISIGKNKCHCEWRKAFDRTRFKYDESGNILAAYLEEEVLGFCIHLMLPTHKKRDG